MPTIPAIAARVIPSRLAFFIAASSPTRAAAISALARVARLAAVPPHDSHPLGGQPAIEQDRSIAERIGRNVQVHSLHADCGPQLVQIAREGGWHLNRVHQLAQAGLDR